MGGIIGGASITTCNNCYNTGDIEATSYYLNGTAKVTYVGGIAGWINNSSSFSFVSNSGSVTNTGGGECTGGIAGVACGWNGSTYAESTRSTLTAGASSGDVTSNGKYTGGIAGSCGNYATCTGLYDLAEIKVKYNTTEANSETGSSPNYLGWILGTKNTTGLTYSNTGAYVIEEDDSTKYDFYNFGDTEPTVITISNLTYWIVNGCSNDTSTIWTYTGAANPTLIWEST